MRNRRRSWLVRLVILFAAANISPVGGDHDLAALASAYHCSASVASAPIERTGIMDAVAAAKAWNTLLNAVDPARAAVDHDNLPVEQVILQVDALVPNITCIAAVFGVPPALLAGLLAAEMDLDYHRADVIVDTLIATGWGDVLTVLDMGMGTGGVHHEALRRALATLGPDLSTSAFYQVYFRITMGADTAQLTRLASRNALVDLANVAVMARHYAALRMGDKPLDSMTVVDMAFTWSAYRGGVVATAADPDGPRRWRTANLQRASDPRLDPDAMLARPYFSYYGVVFGEGRGGAAVS